MLNPTLKEMSNRLSDIIMPPIYVIEPTNSCNVDCIMCPNRHYKEHGMMSFDLFATIVDQISPHAKVIMLYFVGEPLLHPKIVDMIRYCKAHTKASIILSTNAMLLDGVLAEEIIQSGLDEIILCVEGVNASTHERIRRGSDFNRVKENVEQFLVMANRNGTPHCIVQMLRMHMNSAEIDEYKKTWEKYNCTVLITWVVTWANQFPGMARLTDSLSPSVGANRLPCADLWYKMVINWKGEVVLCCLDWSSRHILGNLNTQTVEEVWSGVGFQMIREEHFSGRFSSNILCKNCSEWSSEEEVLDYLREADERKTWQVKL